MPSEGGIIVGWAIAFLLIAFVGYFLWKKSQNVKDTPKTKLHCDTCNTDETFTNMPDVEFKDVYTCPRCGNPRKLVK